MNLIRKEVIISLPVKLAYLFSITAAYAQIEREEKGEEKGASLERLSHLKTLCGGIAIAQM